MWSLSVVRDTRDRAIPPDGTPPGLTALLVQRSDLLPVLILDGDAQVVQARRPLRPNPRARHHDRATRAVSRILRAELVVFDDMGLLPVVTDCRGLVLDPGRSLRNTLSGDRLQPLPGRLRSPEWELPDKSDPVIDGGRAPTSGWGLLQPRAERASRPSALSDAREPIGGGPFQLVDRCSLVRGLNCGCGSRCLVRLTPR
jgi:hypothetical protein